MEAVWDVQECLRKRSKKRLLCHFFVRLVSLLLTGCIALILQSINKNPINTRVCLIKWFCQLKTGTLFFPIATQTWKGPQVVYPSPRHQNDEAVALLSGACLYTGMYTGTVCRSVEQWRFTGGAAGSICCYGLLKTKVLKTYLWYLFAIVYFTSIFQIFLCSFPSPEAKGGLALAQSSWEPTTTCVTHSKQTFE